MDLLRRSMIGWCIAAGWMAMGGNGARAASFLQGEDLVRTLKAGGCTLYVRHATTDFSQKDGGTTDYANCSKQRNLSDAGRKEARVAGDAIRAMALPIGEVLTSPYCRAVETARLMFGRGETSKDAVVGRGADGQPDYSPLLRLVSSAPAPGTLRVIVAHNVPRIVALKEGEAALLKPTAGGFEVMTQVEIAGWTPLARMKV
jgi:phosphohistidine phosphatase SixA